MGFAVAFGACLLKDTLFGQEIENPGAKGTNSVDKIRLHPAMFMGKTIRMSSAGHQATAYALASTILAEHII